MTSSGCSGDGISRRRFLGAAGAGAGAVAAGVPASLGAKLTPAAGDGPVSFPIGLRVGRFTRMFPDLPAFAPPSEALNEALTELSRPGGILDANDNLDAGPVNLIIDPELSVNNPNNPTQTAGVTFLGQFLDHDVTRDRGSTLGQPEGLSTSRNLRSPRFDLDSVYGGGPFFSPRLYTRRPVRFRLESGGLFEDLPRTPDGTAVIADPRNDENLIIAGLHAAMMLFHNAVAERMEAGRNSYWWGFDEIRREVVWHWQWIVWHEYLPTILNKAVLDDIRTRGVRFFRPLHPAVPVEFQGAAFRFGHSQVRPSYRANLKGDNGKAFFAVTLNGFEPDSPDPDSLVGGKRAPRRFIGWQTFFDFGDGEVRPNKKIDTKISTPLFRLPAHTIDRPTGGPLGPVTLATRNLLRHVTWRIPSGQAIAARVGAPVLEKADLADLEPLGAGLSTSTPLWFYVLREAEVMENGERLGPVGSRIVGEVFHALLERDPTSFRVNPAWRPWLPSAGGPGEFRVTDLLTVAGVDPASRGQ